MIKVTGLTALKAKLKLAEMLAKQKVAKTVEVRIAKMFSDLVSTTPQYSGNLASNWYIEINTKSSYRPIAGYDPVNWHRPNPFQAGSPEAVALAKSRELPKLRNLHKTLFSPEFQSIKIVNTAPYASDVEDGIVPSPKGIRSVNLSSEYYPVAMKGYIIQKYGVLKYGK